MPAPAAIATAVRHHAPVLLRQRPGLRPRIALDPVITAVSIRGIDPDALEPRAVPIGSYKGGAPRSLDGYAFEGRLWKRLEFVDAAGDLRPATVESGLGALAGGEGASVSLFTARVPDGHLHHAHQGEAPIPPRVLERAGGSYRALATERVRHGAERDLAHDGRSILMAADHPLLGLAEGARAETFWRAGGLRWRPMVTHDRLEEGLDILYRAGAGGLRIDAVRATKAPLAAAIGEAMRGIGGRDDDLRHFALHVPFYLSDRLSEIPDRDPDMEARLSDLCARAAIDAIGDDLGPVNEAIAGFAKFVRDRYPGRSPTADKAREHARLILSYAERFVRPRLEQGPVPDVDADALDGLAP